MTFPTSYQAIAITAPGGPEVLRARDMPWRDPQDDELVIAVHAAGVNRHDCNQRRRGPTPALARRGRPLHLSPGDGAEFRAPLRTIMAKELRITGSLLRPLPLVAQGKVRPVIHAVLPLHAAAQAHAQMERGAHVGKLVLVPDAPETLFPTSDASP